jgi:hypothetical protein
MDLRRMLGSKTEENEMKFKRTMKEAFGPYTSDELHPMQMCSGPCHQGRKKCPVPNSCMVNCDDVTAFDKWANRIVLGMIVICCVSLVFSIASA